jgi:DedD protein
LEEKLKQRLIGAAVLVALAVIFLPSLLHRDERIVIDTTSQIPPQPPVAESVNIPKPIKPDGIQAAPAPEKLFQPEVIEETLTKEDILPKKETAPKAAVHDSKSNIAETKPKLETVKPKAVKPEEPRLNAAGVPVGWVVQVASLKTLDSAKKLSARLEKDDYRAYHQSVTTDKGEFFRVFIGPFIDQKRALDVKNSIDKGYKVDSRVLRFNPAAGN